MFGGTVQAGHHFCLQLARRHGGRRMRAAAVERAYRDYGAPPYPIFCTVTALGRTCSASAFTIFAETDLPQLHQAAPTPRTAHPFPSLILICCSVALATPAQAEWTALSGLQRSGAVVTAAALDLDNGNMIQQLDADQRLTPASLTKLAVAATALDVWPADKTFQTRVLGMGPFADGRIKGDLIFQSGDSTLDHQALWSLAAQLKGAGVNQVSGRLLVNTAPFGPLGCETKDRCDALRKSDTAYNAPLSAVGVDYGNWCVDLRSTAVGQPALVSGCGVARLPIAIDGSIKTVGASESPTYWIERVTDDGGDRLRVGGAIPLGGAQSMYRAMSDGALGVGLLLKETLQEMNIRIDGAVMLSRDPVSTAAYPLAVIDGLSLKEQLGRMLRFSNNYIADMLTLNLAAAQSPKSAGPLSEAAKTLSEFVGRARIKASKPVSADPPLFSGSGLTPENLLSADDLVALLAAQYRNTRKFPAFYGGLVVPREAPFAFLRVGSPAWLDRVALKTGTMDDPHSVAGISGYVRKKDGGWIAFAAIVNGGPRMMHVPLYKAMEAMRADIDSLLARY
jgi:D-alanyl-D-alanine carboxypeptidase/D-alanyl-D-alanine-endopeptidase (penicillin-binding protein 4)